MRPCRLLMAFRFGILDVLVVDLRALQRLVEREFR
jgi:hypothetical protein